MKLHYEDRGDGSVILLLHGFTGSSADWLPLLPMLPEKHRYIIPDQRGHGRSLNPLDSYTHRQSALDVFELLNELDISTFKACGMSGGAMALLHMATQQPKRLESMILVSPTTHYPPEARDIMALTDPDNQPEAAWTAMRKKHAYGDDQIIQLWKQANAFKDDSDDMAFGPDDLARIQARTLIVHGDKAPLLPIDIPIAIYKNIPHSSLWIIPDGGHVPVFGDQMNFFFSTASQFFIQDRNDESPCCSENV